MIHGATRAETIRLTAAELGIPEIEAAFWSARSWGRSTPTRSSSTRPATSSAAWSRRTLPLSNQARRRPDPEVLGRGNKADPPPSLAKGPRAGRTGPEGRSG